MENLQCMAPARLSPGATVAVLAPASPFDADELDRGASILESMGFKIHKPEGLFSAKGYLAGDDEKRAALLNEAFESPTIDAVICARGGYGSMRILGLVDYGVVACNPKVFIGFSDITALLNVFCERCGLATFHGPTLTSLAAADLETKNALLFALGSGRPISITAENALTLKSGSASGPVAGGNLTTLCHLTGTPFEPCYDGRILFLEDRGEAPYRIDRMLTQMKMAGAFEKVKGLVLGSFSQCGDMESVLRVFEEHFEKHDFPILAGIGAGHERTNLTLPLGIEARLDADAGVLEYLEAATVDRGGGRAKAGTKRRRSPGVDTPGSVLDFAPFERVHDLMRRAVADRVFPGGVLLSSKNGSVMFHKAYGVRNIVSNKPVTVDTVFDLASLTKPLATVSCILALVGEGKLRFQDRLGDILPAFANTSKSGIRLSELLRHTSGMPEYRPYYMELEKCPASERRLRLRRFLLEEPLVYPTGEKTVYSDPGFMILSWVIESVTGLRMDRYAEKAVFEPLGLKDLFYRPLDEHRDCVEYAATENCTWRGRILEGEVHDENAAAAGGVEGHAGLFGTAADVHGLLSHLSSIHREPLFDGLFPRKAVLEALRRDVGSERTMGFDAPSSAGSSSGRLFSFESAGHLGFTGTSFWMDLQRSVIVVLLTNRVHPSRKNEKIKQMRPLIHDAVMGALLEKNGAGRT